MGKRRILTKDNMTTAGAGLNEPPLMTGESLEAVFGEKAGLGADTVKERNALTLTDRRVIRISRTQRGLAASFLSLDDVQTAEVTHTPRNARRLFRMALLLAGAGAALIAVEWPPLSWGLAALLGLGASHHLYQYISVPQEGSILFRGTRQELSVSFRGRRAEQAYDLVNRFFLLKARYSPAPDGGDDGRLDGKGAQRSGRPFREPRGRGAWYETWFMDRSAPVSELRLRDGAKPEEYEAWFLERATLVSGSPAIDGINIGEAPGETDASTRLSAPPS